jgi:hypothetical protein
MWSTTTAVPERKSINKYPPSFHFSFRVSGILVTRNPASTRGGDSNQSTQQTKYGTNETRQSDATNYTAYNNNKSSALQ